jgi:SpoVK/Ycf46/Vps4 family AAA+-type ATPase
MAFAVVRLIRDAVCGIVGESESRVRQMIQLTEAIAPCVLWIDEMIRRLGISLLVRMGIRVPLAGYWQFNYLDARKNNAVFIVATANNVRILPAELLRKGDLMKFSF